jgi:hypothetical protein
MGKSVYRSFKGTPHAQLRSTQKRVRATLDALKGRVAACALTDDDHRIIARLGANALAYIGYQRRVELT